MQIFMQKFLFRDSNFFFFFAMQEQSRAAFADRAVLTITELANSSIGVNDNLDEDENVTSKSDKVNNTGDSVKVGNVAEKVNDYAGEVDDTVANYATDCIRSQLISKAKLFSDKEIYKLLIPGCVNMINAVQRSEYV